MPQIVAAINVATDNAQSARTRGGEYVYVCVYMYKYDNITWVCIRVGV